MVRRRPYSPRFAQREDEKPSFDPAEREIAWKAITAFRTMLPSIRSFARVVSDNPKLDVQITTQRPYTKGNVIYIQPPLALGRDLTHDRPCCGRRAANGKQLCPACQTNEVINFTLYHEVGHVFFDSQALMTGKEVLRTENLLREWHDPSVCSHPYQIPARWSGTAMELLNEVNPYLPLIFNCFEDTRVNEATFLARPGLRGVFDANIDRLMEEGAEISPGIWKRWIDEPLDAQFTIGLFLTSSSHYVEGRLHEDVVKALRSPKISAICDRAASCTSALKVFYLSIEAFLEAQHLGYCVVPKCEPVPHLPGPPPPEDEAGNSDETSDDTSSEGSAESNSDSSDSAEEDNSEGGDQANDDSQVGKSEEQTEQDGTNQNPTDEVSDDDPDSGNDGSEGGTSEVSGDDGDGMDSDEEASTDPGKSDEASDSSDGAGDGGSDDEGEHSGAASSVGSELDSDEAHESSESSPERPSQSDKNGVSPGKLDPNGGNLDNSERGNISPENDGSRVGESDDDGSSSNEQAPVNEDAEDAEDAEEAFDEEECDHVGEYECSRCGADLTLLDDNPWDTPGMDDMQPVEGVNDGPNGPVDGLEPVTPRHGTPDDAATAVGRFLMHPLSDHESGGLLDDMAGGDIEALMGSSEHEDMKEMLAELVKVAASQCEFFAKDSAEVEGVEYPSYPDKRVRWDITDFSREIRTSREQIIKSVMPSEDLIGSATQHMRKIFQDNLMVRRNRGLKAGRLDMRSLARRAPVQDDRIFGKRIKPRDKSYAVLLGIDCSGSTDNVERNAKIKRAAMAQAEVLTRLGIPWAGYAHTAFQCKLDNSFRFNKMDGMYSVYLLPFKTAGEPWTDLGREKLSAIRPLSENLDGHTLEQYINKLLAVEAEERILFYYTDGQMPAANYSEELEILTAQCKRADDKGIHLMGVGINTDSPKQYGMDTVEVNSDEDIALVIKQLERRLSK
jgi:hypothetical protein